ncbi:MAG: hypothetical protein AAF206_04775 [Bacteroidota bacterium]
MTEKIKQHLIKTDEIMAGIIEQIDLPEIKRTDNVFHDLMSCIIEQQIHYRSTKKTFAKLMAEAGLEELTLGNFEVLEEKALGKIKLSEKKFETIAHILDFFQSEEPDWQSMTDAEVKKALSGIKGVGPWTQEMILLYSLNRPDIFPAGDYHLKKVMQDVYEIDSSQPLAREMKRVAVMWEPYRSFGVRYLLEWKRQK